MSNSNPKNVFISWSGDRSKEIADALSDFLPRVVNAVEPWVSSKDIDKGSIWFKEISKSIDQCKAGLIVLTPDNLSSPWITFEGGALFKSVMPEGMSTEEKHVCTLLCDGLRHSESPDPFKGFNGTLATKDDLRLLVETLNRIIPGGVKDQHLKDNFDANWERLASVLNAKPLTAPNAAPIDVPRLVEEIHENVLALRRVAYREESAFPADAFMTRILRQDAQVCPSARDELMRRLVVLFGPANKLSSTRTNSPAGHELDPTEPKVDDPGPGGIVA